MNGKEVSLYFHIPFCLRKCPYCQFYSIRKDDPLIRAYLEALELEWEQKRALLATSTLASVYFGGGTPTLLSPEAVDSILSWVRALFPLDPDIEVTLEANPESVTLEKMQAFASCGVNRVSLGVQSFDQKYLNFLGRVHTIKEIEAALSAIQTAKIDNISIDLIYALPHQTVEEWLVTLGQLRSFPMVTHLSFYDLVIEPNTPFDRRRRVIEKTLPDSDVAATMYLEGIALLGSLGFDQYEISAFAKNQLYSKHNKGYWTGRSFLGLGPSAFSYWEGRRFSNCADLHSYCEALQCGRSTIDFEEKLPPEQSQRELLALGLRLSEGVELTPFHLLGEETKEKLSQLEKEAFLEKQGNAYTLTQKGKLFYDTVASLII